MNTVPVYVGLDYHQDSVRLCVMDREGKMLANRDCRNDWRHLAAVAAGHGTVVKAAVESCCGAADLADELITNAGWSLSMAHPGFVKRMKTNPDKTDWADARILADLQR